jgi:hypothetical protein
MIKNDNDAASCYDRIFIYYLGNIMSRKMGMPVKVCQVQEGMNIEEAKYHIKTLLGTSVTFITHCEDSPWHGSGHGPGWQLSNPVASHLCWIRTQRPV